MTDHRYRNEDWLREQYQEREKPMRVIAEMCNTYPPTIKRWLDKHNIPTRNKGGASSSRSVEDRFWEKVDTGESNECWEWQGFTDPYGMFSFNGEGKVAHRVSFYLEHGDWPDNLCLHHCDNPPCVNPNHLYDGTQSDNMEDAHERDRRPPGGRNPALSPEEVKDVRQRADEGDWGIQQELASEYEVTESVISKVVHRVSPYDKERPRELEEA